MFDSLIVRNLDQISEKFDDPILSTDYNVSVNADSKKKISLLKF